MEIKCNCFVFLSLFFCIQTLYALYGEIDRVRVEEKDSKKNSNNRLNYIHSKNFERAISFLLRASKLCAPENGIQKFSGIKWNK